MYNNIGNILLIYISLSLPGLLHPQPARRFIWPPLAECEGGNKKLRAKQLQMYRWGLSFFLLLPSFLLLPYFLLLSFFFLSFSSFFFIRNLHDAFWPPLQGRQGGYKKLGAKQLQMHR